MAEKIVFGADIDNVTIKNVNGVLVAVGGSEAAEDEVSYVVRYPDGSEISGTHTYTGKYLSRLEVSGYKNEASSYERWEFKPYVVENFNGKLTVSPQTYTEGTL